MGWTGLLVAAVVAMATGVPDQLPVPVDAVPMFDLRTDCVGGHELYVLGLDVDGDQIRDIILIGSAWTTSEGQSRQPPRVWIYMKGPVTVDAYVRKGSEAPRRLSYEELRTQYPTIESLCVLVRE